MARTTSGGTQLHFQWIVIALSLEGIGPEYKVGHSSPASFVVYIFMELHLHAACIHSDSDNYAHG
jgi:hypothetical protein